MLIIAQTSRTFSLFLDSKLEASQPTSYRSQSQQNHRHTQVEARDMILESIMSTRSFSID